MSIRSSITIDLIVKGLERIERIGAILGALVANSRFTNGFILLRNALGSVSIAAQNAFGVMGRFAVLISAMSSNPQFVAFCRAIADALRAIKKELDDTTNKTKKNSDAWKNLSLAMGIISILIRSVGFLIRDLGLNLLRTSQRIGAFFKKITEAGGDIEQKFSELQALLSEPTQASDSFQKLTQEIIRVGESSSQTISQVAGLANELARAGFNTEEITASIDSVVQLSEAAGISADDAARIASNVKTMFSLQASELSRVNDVLTATANASTSSVQSLGESFTYVGPLAASFGFSVEEIAAALGVLANAGQRGCYDAETEVLTKGGWVRWDRVTGDETFATVNQKTNELEYHPALRNIKYKHTGKMYKVDLQSVDLLVTPNHNMYVQLRGDDEYRLIKAEDVFEETFKYKTRVSYSGTRKDKFVLPGVPVFMGNRSETRSPVEINMDDWVSFMGAYLSEGCVSEDDKGNYRIFISQYESSKGYEKFKEVIGRLPFAFKYDGKRFVCRDYQLFQHLKTYGKASQKFVPEEFFNLSKEQINLFLEFYRLGDGTKKEKHGRFVMTTVSPMMEQDLARLGVLAGYTVKTKSRQPRTSVMKDGRQVKGKHTQFDISFTSHQRYSNPVNNPLEVKRQSTFSGESWVDFDGFVYCVEVPNNTLIIRRNGKVIICGNSVAGAGLQQMFSQLIAHSDKVDVVLKRYGSSFEAVNPEIHSVTEIMAEFNRVNLSSAEIIDIFSERARKTFLALNSQGIDTLKTFEDLNRTSAGMAKTIAETRMDNLSGDILRLKSAFEALQYEIFEAIKDQLESFVELITGLVRSARTFVKENQKMVAGLADLAKTLALTSGGLAGLTLLMSSFTRFSGLIAGGLATVLAGFTMLGPPVQTGALAIKELIKSFVKAALFITPITTSLGSLWKTLIVVTKSIAVFSLGLLGFTGVAGIVAAAVFVIVHNWEYFSGVLQDFYDNTWLPFYYGFMHGFMEGYQDYIKPAIDGLTGALGELVDSFSSLFGEKSESYDNFKNFGNTAAYIATGFIYAFEKIIQVIKKTVDMSKSLVDAYNYVSSGIANAVTGDLTQDQLMDLLPDTHKSGGRPSLEQSLTPAAQIEAYKKQIRDLAVGHNELMKGIVDTSVGLDKVIPQYEKAASMLSRITELKPNELTELENTLSGIRDLGKDFDLQSVSTAFNDVQGEVDKLQAHRDKLVQYQKSGGFETALGMLGVGEQGASAAMKVVENMVKQSDKMLEDLVKKRDKLAASKENMRLIDILAGAGGFEQFQADRAAMKAELDAIASDVEKKSTKLAKLKSSVGWMSTGATNEEERQQKIKELELSLSAAQSKAQGLTEALGMMGSISNEKMFNTLREGLFFGADTFGDPVGGLIEALRRLRDDEMKAKKATEEWEEAQKSLNDTLDESSSKVEQLRREIELTTMDAQSREELQIKIKTEDALKELDALQLKLEEARKKALAAGLDASAPEVQAIDQQLADITQTRIDFATHGANEITRVQNEADEKRTDDIMDMELSLAKDKKDQAREVALTQQKWNQETLDKLEKNYTEVDANGVKRMRAGADEFKKLRAEQLQQQLDDINKRYEEEQKKDDQSAQKRPVDRAKEMVDIQNEAYQILLKKVNTTRDLFALERALLKIQEMQLANALKMSSRAVRAETSVEMAKRRHEEALLRGDDPLKTAEALKKAQERAGIMRGASDLRNRQMGIGTSDVNAMNVASASMDATSQMVLQRIGDKMKVIAQAMNGMTATFSSIAEGWINAFIESWDKNSIRLQETVMRTLSQLQIGLNTAALGNPGLSGAMTASNTAVAAVSPNGSSVVNNFQVNANDPMEAGKKMARLIDQSTRDT